MPSYRDPYAGAQRAPFIPGGSIRDLLLERGRIAADRAYQSGNIWGPALAQIGATLGGGLMQYASQREEKKQQEAMAVRDATALKYISAWDGEDPKSLFTGLTQILGPTEGPKMAKAVVELNSKPKSDPKSEMQALALTIDVAKNQSDDMMQAGGWQAFRQRFNETAPKLGITQLPEQWDPANRQVMEVVGNSLNKFLGTEEKKAPLVNVPPEHVVFDPNTGQAVFTAPPKEKEPAKGPTVGSFEDYVRRAYGENPTPQQVIQARVTFEAAGRKPEEGPSQIEVGGYLEGLRRGDISMSDVPAKEKQAVLAAAGAQGIDTRTAKQKEIDTAAESVLSALKQISDQAEKTMTATSGPGAVAQGAAQRALNVVGLAEQTRLWDAQAAKFSQLARQLGERGTLTEGDIKRIQDGFPSLTDPVTVRDAKLKNIRDIIISGLRGKVSSRVSLGGGMPSSVGRYKIVAE